MTFPFHLTWQRAVAGYRIEERKPEKPKKTVRGRRRSVLMDLFIPGWDVVRNGGRLEDYEVFKLDGLYHHLANTEPTPEGVLGFVERFGMPEFPKASSLSVETFEDHIMSFRALTDLAASEEWQKLHNALQPRWEGSSGRGNLFCDLIPPVGADRPEIRLRPRNLIQAIYLQFMLDCADKAKFRKCRRCGTWFRYGSGTKHRSTATYCQPKCQKAHAYDRRKQELAPK